jgi:peptidoglycan/xylan/chitin deacetylase (PgdA/CDA1 family)
MYHQVVAENPGDIHAVSVEMFADQMRWLHKHSYQVTAVEELFSGGGFKHSKSRKPQIAITFDDGYLDNFTNALPILKDYGFKATIFLVSKRVGRTNDWDQAPSLAGAPLLGWKNIQEMADYGIQFGAHSCTHPDLTHLLPWQVKAEINSSRRIIEQQLQSPIRTFAYPYSRFDESITKMVLESGFEYACTYQPGYVGGAGIRRMALQRTGILATDTLEDFVGKVQARILWRYQWFWRTIRNFFKINNRNRQ